MKKNFGILPLVVCISIPLFAGIIIGALTRNSVGIYQSVSKPSFAPPSGLFPVVWGILYTLMGVSLYLICRSGSETGKNRAYLLFAVQLAVNLLWPLLFFGAENYTAAFVCLIALWILILLMILSYRKISPAAAYLQIPYLLWVTFAGVLNYYAAFK